MDRLERELSDLDDGGAEGEGARRLGAAPLAVAGLAVLALGGLIFYAYNEGIREGTEVAAPIVLPEGPAKVKPEDPGGLAVPHQDKTVYNVVQGADSVGTEKVETLLPPPEEPIAPSQVEPAVERQTPVEASETILAEEKPEIPTIQPPPLPEGELSAPEGPVVLSNETVKQVAAAQKDTNVEEKAAETVKSETTVAGATTQVAAAPKASEDKAKPAPPKVEQKAENESAPKQEEKPVQVAAAPATPKTSVSNLASSWRIQVGAVRSEDAAKKEWARLQKRNNDLIGKLNLEVQSVEVKGKGLYFRIRGGPLNNKSAADGLCTKLKAQKVACIPVRPGA